jgi:hypothetical protein
MTQDEIIEMASPAKWIGCDHGWTFNTYKQLDAFAKRIAQHERDRMCEQCKWRNHENTTHNEAN